MGSSRNQKAQPTVEEIVALLKKTDLPTVVCEGSDDLIVYRRLEERLSHIGVSVLSAGGRNNVLQLFERRGEIPSSVRLAFIADRDTWISSRVPAVYIAPTLCLTSGYSIENDVIIDGGLEALLVGSELTRYKAELIDFIDWYALALDRHMVDQSYPIAYHPDYVLNPTEKPALLKLRAGEVYPTALRSRIGLQYRTDVRGKSLMALLLRSLNARSGQPKHSDKALLEMVAARPGPLLARIASEVEAAITPV